MTHATIAQQRLINQHIIGARLNNPAEIVRWLGAVQAQDYAGASWALGLRLQNITANDIDQALAEGSIIRTHVMRPTWHFVAAEDIHWLLALTGPRVKAGSAYWYRKLELDEAIFQQSYTALIKALQGGMQLTRAEIATVLQQAGIAIDDQRSTYLIMRAELDMIICSGAKRDKQFTYALFAERVPANRILTRDEALAELANRYFSSHGPATESDFVWWSGLTHNDAKTALEIVSSKLMCEVIDGKTYWSAQPAESIKDPAQSLHILPNYDEYIVGYTDRNAIFDAEEHNNKLDARGNVLFNHTIVVNNQVTGTWKRTIKKDSIIFTPLLFTTLSTGEKQNLILAAERYGTFLGKSIQIEFKSE